MSVTAHGLPEPDPDPFAALLPAGLADVAVDRAHREVHPPDDPPFLASAHAGLELRVLELVRTEGRLVAQLAGACAEVPLPGAELFVQRGTLTLDGQALGPGTWLRQPLHGPAATAGIALSSDALLLLSIGQIPPEDAERRQRDTAHASGWLDGPNEGIEVLPLHGSGAANVMLMRWNATVAFRPSLDPVGDEVFVLSGELHDSHGSFGSGSWIRNPVPAWQSWAGTPGTLVCYKSGHFTAEPDADFARHTR